MHTLDDTVLRELVPAEDRALFEYICSVFAGSRHTRICLTPASYAALYVAAYHSVHAHGHVCRSGRDAGRQLRLAEELLVQMSGGSTIGELMPGRAPH